MTMTAAAGEEPRKGRGQETRPTEVKARRDRLDQAKPGAAREEPDAAYGPWPAALPTCPRCSDSCEEHPSDCGRQDRLEALCHAPSGPRTAGAKESAEEELDQ